MIIRSSDPNHPDLLRLHGALVGGRMRYRYRRKSGSIYSKLIKLWPFGGAAGSYSHVEMQFSNGMSWSSDEADKGTRFRWINYEGDEWDTLEVPVTAVKEREIWDGCVSENGLGYDWRGIGFSFLPIPIGWQSPDKWFCSEAVTAMGAQKQHLLIGQSPAAVAPSRMYKLMAKDLELFPQVAPA